MPGALSTALSLAAAFPWTSSAMIHRGPSGSLTGFPTFESFMESYSRTYKRGSEEYKARHGHYAKRVAAAREHNSNNKKKWTASVNNLWDWSDAELAVLRGRRGSSGAKRAGGFARSAEFIETGKRGQAHALPDSISWTNISTMATRHDQGACGSCWAIATSTVLQAHFEIHRGQPRTFSIQQLVSCVPNPQECGGQGGCRGATVELAMDYVLANGCSEEFEVPYAAQDLNCTASPQASIQTTVFAQNPALSGSSSQVNNGLGLTGWTKLPENSYMDLMNAVVSGGPVAVSVAAHGWADYGYGIYDRCTKDCVIDHAVVLVGYGVNPLAEDKYWLVQNSWGRGWGEAGNIRLLRRENEQEWCGEDKKPELGTACKPYPQKVTVCGQCGILYDSVVPHFQSSI